MAGKGDKRRKGADISTFSKNYDKIDWSTKIVEKEICPRCGTEGYHNCQKMAGEKSRFGPLPMEDHSLGWPYTDPNIDYDC